jgi:WD40 repeat protein
MAVKLVHHPASRCILIIAGYEGGHTAIHQMPLNGDAAIQSADIVYLSHPHTQPILSLDTSLETNTYFTSSADANIAAHRIPNDSSGEPDTQSTTFPREGDKHDRLGGFPSSSTESAEQSLDYVSNDSRNAALSALNETLADAEQTGQPDFAPETLAVSKEPISSAALDSSLSFTKKVVHRDQTPTTKPAGLSSLLSPTTLGVKTKPPSLPKPVVTLQLPFKTTNTKHAGQQSLRVRSDGRILVTGGWDSRIRIYSTKTLKEVAVLKWHKEGVYAVDFATVLTAEDLQERADEDNNGNEVAKRETGLGKLQRQREEQMQFKHWVVAGAKDGKVSLWEVF